MSPSSRHLLVPALAAVLAWTSTAAAQTGVDDDRVSLPEGPGSLEGVGDDVEFDANMGAMIHTVPITVPQGFAGVTPDLTLRYNSGASSGPLGIGWSMSLSSVGRMTSRGAPNYTTEDLFDVGGAELVQVGSANGELVYRARFEGTFVRYRWVNAADGGEGYWVADHPDGSQSFFGADRNGMLVPNARRTRPGGGTAEYHLVETVDVYDHAVTYSYGSLDGTVPLLTGVSYVDDGLGNGDIYGIDLAYEARPDVLSDASRGYEELTVNRLRSMTVLNGSNIIREYVLSYEDDSAAGGFSRLARVQQYGTGGRVGGSLYPIVHEFGYSAALGVDCVGADCDTPFLVEMGTLQGSVTLSNGRATLVDINADGLPDVVDTTEAGAHRFFMNQLTPQGLGFDHDFSAPVASAIGTGSAFRLGGGEVQVLDVNGDGRADLLETNTGTWLENGGDGDWSALNTVQDVTRIRNVDFSDVRFIDIDDDKRVDLLTSTSQTTTLYRNGGSQFTVDAGIMPIGAPFGTNGVGVQFADINGDGLSDPVEIRQDGSLRYRLNLGRGNWSGQGANAWRPIDGLSISANDLSRLDLEDLNGDGLDDIVIVGQTNLRYAINRNGSRFDPFRVIDSEDIVGEIPERGAAVAVFYADMNGNGSEDVVWFSGDGAVSYLELFPRRPNLLTRITNGIGSVQEISYTTAAEEASRARGEGNQWTYELSIPMNMVASIDRYVTLTGSSDGSGLHEITRMTYRDGFYDGLEKQYRGFERVETVVEGDAFQEEANTILTFDVGRSLPHRNGLPLTTTVRSGGRVLSVTRNSFMDCPLDEVPAPATLEGQGRRGVYFPCNAAMEVEHQEGLTRTSEWKTVRTEMDYDGYGNVRLESELGVVSVSGDELYTETSYAAPSAERWLIRLPFRERVYDNPNNTDFAETLTYYDGDDFQGLPLGQATAGFVSRRTLKVDEGGTILNEVRSEGDSDGNTVTAIDPNGSISDVNTHRRSYVYDESGIFLLSTSLHNVDNVGQPYFLRRETGWERSFQRVSEATEWFIVRGAAEETSRDSSFYRYDEFGRLASQTAPGDMQDRPASTFTYELGADRTRIRARTRTTQNGPLDQEHLTCMDGRGRIYQNRRRIQDGRYQISGFRAYNARGVPVQVWQSYVSPTGDCEASAPSAVLSTTNRYDALGRSIEVTQPGAGVYGEDISSRIVYLPLARLSYDEEDTNSNGTRFETPTIMTTDGLGRTISIERSIRRDGNIVRSGNALHYDSTGTFSGYTTSDGKRHLLSTDLIGRTIGVSNPNLGSITYVYDDAGNIVSITDGRGVTQTRVYDGQNRIKERFDEADRAATLVTWFYDFLPDGCDRTECTNLAGSVAMISYPIRLLDDSIIPSSDRFGYDVQRREVLAGRRLGTLADLVNRRTFDHRDRLTSITYPDGTLLEQVFDGTDRLVSVPGYVDSLTYEDRGLLDGVSFANQASVQYGFDDLERLATMRHLDGSGAVFHDVTITMDRADNMLSVADSTMTPVDLSQSLVLDDWYRVMSADYGDSSESFQMDLTDRITQFRDTALAYSPQQSLTVTSAGVLPMAYDGGGNMESRADTDYVRDELGRIRTISRGGAIVGAHAYSDNDRVVQVSSDGTLVLYGFDEYEVRDGIGTMFVDVNNERVVRREGVELGAVVYGDGNGNMIVDAGDALTGGSRLPVLHVLAAAAARLLFENEDELAFIHTDHLGTHVAATDAGGAVRGNQAFNQHGSPRASDGYVGTYGFTGLERDATTGFIHAKYRELDSLTGRWDRFDPKFVSLGPADMASLGEATTGYAYVANNPGTGSDPTGLEGFFGKIFNKIFGKSNGNQVVIKIQSNNKPKANNAQANQKRKKELSRLGNKLQNSGTVYLGQQGPTRTSLIEANSFQASRKMPSALVKDAGKPKGVNQRRFAKADAKFKNELDFFDKSSKAGIASILDDIEHEKLISHPDVKNENYQEKFTTIMSFYIDQ
ncbi:MAG: toxin TcdB middle/N-terminal domain-containing protein [Myxococcota bacterium]